MEKRSGAVLRLQNGLEFKGRSFGSPTPCTGEVVFSTAMVGYPESLTDPACSDQILCATYPLIGNYGVPEENLTPEGLSAHFESERIWVRGLVISDYSCHYSHWDAVKSLDQWMKEQGVPGISGIDTRLLAQTLRDEGVQSGCIFPEGSPGLVAAHEAASAAKPGFGSTTDTARAATGSAPATAHETDATARSGFGSTTDTARFAEGYPETTEAHEAASTPLLHPVARVSCRRPVTYGSGSKRIVVADYGVRHSVLRALLGHGLQILRVPWDYDFNLLEYDGLLLSSGPGNPEGCGPAIRHIRTALQRNKPVFGVGLGCSLLALASGASVYKLKSGHRGLNQPVRSVGLNRCLITSQNHGYAVDDSTLGPDWEPWFVNMNDGSNEGIRHKTRPFSAVQFYPETGSDGGETAFLFGQFIGSL